jgi:hypothetical protein
MRLERVAWLTALRPITVAGPRPIFTALPHFSSLQIVNSVYGAPPTLSIKPGLPETEICRDVLADQNSAFQSFEEAYQQHVFRIIELTMPMYDSLRSDSRWQNLVRRIGLPQ